MVNECTVASICTIYDLLNSQRNFQKSLGNNLPENSNTSFENVQSSISHNVYQMIEFQEFIEANDTDRKEELIDYLLFMLNKYIYLIDINDKKSFYKSFDLNDLYVKKSEMSVAQCSYYANLEQNSYISLLRNHCTFKPWKVYSKEQSCSNAEKVEDALDKALFYFKQMSEIVFDSYEDFKNHLMHKLEKNVIRQKNGY